MDKITVLVMKLLQYLSLLVIAARNTWNQYSPPAAIELATRPDRRYLLGADSETLATSETVPEGKIYIEEWVQGDSKRCVIRYGGEEIPRSWTTTPFQKHARTPWVWIGDRETEIDLTRTFNKYLVVGNVIKVDLVSQLIQVNERSNLLYIESGTFKELKFPGDGITIEEYDDHRSDHRPVQNS
jgi:hypothetical protein